MEQSASRQIRLGKKCLEAQPADRRYSSIREGALNDPVTQCCHFTVQSIHWVESYDSGIQFFAANQLI